jgi:hypothetical protein
MKMKIFDGIDRPGLERKINEWLRENKLTNLKFIAQSESGGHIVITVWYNSN